MRINTRIVIDMATYTICERESFMYDGPVAQCCGGGPGGGGPSTGNIAGQSVVDMAGMESAESGQDTAPTPSSFGGEGSSNPGLVGPGNSPGAGFGVSPQIGFSSKGFELGSLAGSIFGAGGAIVGGLVGAVAPSALSGSGVPGEMDMSGDPTGGNAISGPDITPVAQSGPAKPKVAPETIADKPIGPSLEDVEADARKEEDKKARKRPKTILTSPLGLTGKATIRRATLLGG